MEFPSYGLIANTKPDEQVLLIDHADNLQDLLFFFVLGIYIEFGFRHIGPFSYVHYKGPTHEYILSIYTLYTVCVYIYIYAYSVYTKAINDQYQQ